VLQCDVVAVTCAKAMDKEINLDGIEYNCLILDEATQIVEALMTLPISRDYERVVLIGDQKQLPPFFNNNKFLNSGFDKSLFELILDYNISNKQNLVILKRQYRMHPSLSKFSNQFF